MRAYLAHSAAVTLFVQRAQAIAPDFVLTETNAHIIAQICSHLDGLPLAIELAAARIKLLSPQQLLSRLEHRLAVLTGGGQDLPVRQQTLRKTLQWSYDLLNPDEQRLFRLLSVFVGGCTLEAVEAMCRMLGSGATAVLDGVQKLLDNNLIFQRTQPGGEPRLVMLETIREYGQEQLAASGEMEGVEQAHAGYHLTLAEAGAPQLPSAEQLQWFDRLEQEHDNLRAALRWLLEKEQIEQALRLSGALHFFWLTHAHLREGRHWLEQALVASNGVMTPVRAMGLYTASALAYFSGDYTRSAELCTKSLKLYRRLGEKQGIATALNGLGHIARTTGDYAALRVLCGESVQLLQEGGDRWRLAEALHLSAYAFHAEGDDTRAWAVGEESLALCRQVGDCHAMAEVLRALGLFASTRGDHTTAQRLYKESLVLSREVGDKQAAALCLVGLGEVAAAAGTPVWAARLWGAAEALRTASGTIIPPAEHVSYDRSVIAVRAWLGEDDFRNAWADGQTGSLDQVLADREPMPVTPQPLATLPSTVGTLPSHAGLTVREMDVLRLLTQGLTSAQIAEQLVIGLVTVNFHVRSIYRKLGVSSRSAATRYAIEHNLV